MSREPIAVIGIGCRFPGGASDPDAYWEMLRHGTDAISDVPADRWNARTFFHEDPAMPGAIAARRGGFLEHIDRFDAAFFGMSPREASRVDPQHRLLAEVAWEALEDGGQPPERLAGSKTGVFVGISCHDYYDIQISPDDWDTIDAHTATGGALSIAANRLSYLFDLRGPSLSVDTACSSALVAVHLACRSIDDGDCRMALAGGVNALIAPPFAMCLSKLAMLSPDGRCKAFDARANGYVRAEGAGLVLLKPLSRALADRDRIHAIIRGTAVTQDGRTPGITVPSGAAQEAAAREACRQANVDPAQIGYIEAHGTGTPVGDPIEANALGAVFGAGRAQTTRCLIGSVKTNVGHLESAAGAAGLIKTVLMLRHRTIVPSLHFETPNPEIPFEELRLRVATKTEPWMASPGSRLAGVNSFGFGGTNAHVILGEPPIAPHATPATTPPALLLSLSARGPDALRARAHQLARRLEKANGDAGSICQTVWVSRGQHTDRLSIAARDGRELADKLDAWMNGDEPAHTSAGVVARGDRPPTVAFVFCGQGAQWWAMGRGLLEAEPVFREAVERVDALVSQRAGWRLKSELLATEDASRVHQTDILQPAVFAVQVGLAALWRSWGVTPRAVIGHSMGEMASAYVAGALALEDAVHVIVERARIQHQASGTGKMLAVGLSSGDAQRLVQRRAGTLWVAGRNGPSSVTFGGDVNAIDQLHAELQASGVFSRVLQVACACHTPHMDRYRDELLRDLAGVRPRRGSAAIYSTVTGDRIDGTELDTNYWWQNFRQPVLFEPAIQRMLADGIDTFVELGPHSVLSSAIRDCAAVRKRRVLAVPSLRRQEDDVVQMRASLGALYVRGHAVAGDALEQGDAHAALPSYPWQRTRHWHESEAAAAKRLGEPGYQLPGERLQVATPVFQRVLDARRLRWLPDHRISGSVVMPGAGYVAATLAVAAEATGGGRRTDPGQITLEDVEFRRALVVPDAGRVTMQWSFDAESAAFDVASRRDGDAEWSRHSEGRLFTNRVTRPDAATFDMDAANARCPHALAADSFYEEAAARGVVLGPSFRGIKQLWYGDGEAVAIIEPPPEIVDELDEYPIHPAVLDACFQVVLGSLPRSAGGLYLPVAIKRLRWLGNATGRIHCHVRPGPASERTVERAIDVYDDTGRLVFDISGIRCRRVEDNASRNVLANSIYRWEWRPAPRAPVRAAGFAPLASLGADLTRDANQLAMELEWTTFYTDVERALSDVCAAFAGNALRELGGGVLDIDVARSRTSARHERAFERIVELTRRFPDAARRSDADAMLDAVRAAHPAYAAECTVLSNCGRQLAQVLRGEQDALALIFPPGNTAAAASLYDDAPVSRLYNELARRALLHAIRDRTVDEPLRVLEIGGGTGGLTGHLIPLVESRDGAEYCFTDVSPVFTTAAERRFSPAAPPFRARLLDIERPPEEQGFARHQYDVVVASNVLHATRDLRASLRHARELLAPGGLLILLELTLEVPWLDLIFGLTEGWWRFEDTDLRPAYPLLPRGKWVRVLEEAGFADVTAISDTTNAVPAQSVLVARAPAILDQTAVLAERGPWGIVGRESGEASRLEAALASRGVTCARVCANESELRDLLSGALTGGVAPRGVIHVETLDFAPLEETAACDLDGQQTAVCHGLATLARIASTEHRSPPRLWLVVRGANAVDGGANRPEAAPVWGIGRVALIEHPELRCRMIDLDPDAPFDPNALLLEVSAPDAHEEIAFRGGQRLTPHLTRVELHAETVGADNYTLRIGTPGVLDTLAWHSAAIKAPRAREVAIDVESAGLNYRDVMIAMGLLPEEATGVGESSALGVECAGRVVAVGDDVTDFAVGDEVLGMSRSGAFTRVAIAPAYGLMRKPTGMSFEEAASVAGVFLTAQYALMHLARLRCGERVLIHSAAGGVGLAALQVAQRAGAIVLATAGSEEKRAYLRSRGVLRAMDSRTLAFADEVLEATNGDGVDVVLNSLAGEAIAKSLSVLRPYGRFIEIGKRDIYRNTPVGLRPFAHNLSLSAFDLLQLYADQPETIATLTREIESGLAAGDLRPLPLTVFPMADAPRAFRHMGQARHIGKIVLARSSTPVVQTSHDGAAWFSGEKTYIITGGTSGFGLFAAGWLARHGARHFVLVSRRGVIEASAGVEALRATGACVRVERADVADERQMARMFRTVREEMPVIGGVIHAAHVQTNSLLAHLDEPRIREVLASKVAGAFNLHRLTLDTPLDFFVLFSSAASIYGSFGQASYVAGNAFLDALAHYRAARGLPALSVNWGWLGDTGYVSRHTDVARLVAAQGLQSFQAEDAMDVLGRLLREGQVQAAPMLIDWNAWRASATQIAASPRFAGLGMSVDADTTAAGSGPTKHPSQAVMLAPDEERLSLVQHTLRDQLSRILGAPPEQLGLETRLSDFGVDSLMTVELQARIEREFGVEIPVMQLMQGTTIAGLSSRILSEMISHASGGPSLVSTSEETQLEIEPDRARSEPTHPAMGLVPINGNAPRRTFLQRVGRPLCALGLRSLLRVRLEGMENIPTSGAVILAGNHVNALDALFLFAFMPERMATGFAADYLRDLPVLGWFMSVMLNSIFVKRGEGDLEAIGKAVDALDRGDALMIAPEGTRSRDAVLRSGKTGVAWIAMQSGAPVIPVAAFGHERPGDRWKRLRRPAVTIRVGRQISEPPVDSSRIELERFTDDVMVHIARLMPEHYRGEYRERSE